VRMDLRCSSAAKKERQGNPLLYAKAAVLSKRCGLL
jgi:hypothetical protein